MGGHNFTGSNWGHGYPCQEAAPHHARTYVSSHGPRIKATSKRLSCRKRARVWLLGRDCEYVTSHPRGLSGAPCKRCGGSEASHWALWRRILDALGLEVIS